ncbi:MAG: 30S ribosomal protein S3 [Puniceicoccales bacterium]|jgi:small subunit ribosomal protein S3|nr:30S ribosomal protein S3 [Puniceicoccales bacterium]
MGQKVNPIGFRLAVRRNWESRWYADKKTFPLFVKEDFKIREFLRKHKDLRQAAIPRIYIERANNRIRVKIFTARPGVIIGKRGDNLETLRKEISVLAGREVILDIHEVRKSELIAQLVAENIALQLERRVAFRRAMKKAVQNTINAGADGIRLRLAGRLGGAEIARVEAARVGRVPLHTLRANIDYGFAEARTIYGKLGVKCWICSKETTES